MATVNSSAAAGVACYPTHSVGAVDNITANHHHTFSDVYCI